MDSTVTVWSKPVPLVATLSVPVVALLAAVGAIETARLTEPPEPLHVRVYVPDEVMVSTSLPDVAFEPLHAPDAEHEVASLEDHEIVDGCPLATSVGAAESVSVGNGAGSGVESGGADAGVDPSGSTSRPAMAM